MHIYTDTNTYIYIHIYSVLKRHSRPRPAAHAALATLVPI
jgi:hypothetical protein